MDGGSQPATGIKNILVNKNVLITGGFARQALMDGMMKYRSLFAVAICSLLLVAWVVSSGRAQQSNWTSWRGPDGTGANDDASPPVRWSEQENVRWKTAIPGLGHSTPVVWQDRVYVTTAIPTGEKFAAIADNRPGSHDNLKVSQRHQYAVFALDRTTGKVIWKKTVHENIPHEGGHDTASLASASPVTDGKRLIVSFGSHGVFALDFQGQIVWEKQLGKMHSKHGHGEGASPVVQDGYVVINWDQEEQSFLIALDSATGKQKWKVIREEVTSWSSPIVYQHEGQNQVIVAGTNRVRGYELETGKVIWECGGLSHNVVATPIAHAGMVFVASSYEKRAMIAINLKGAKGDITGTKNVAWTRNTRTPYVPSPLLYRGKLYFLRHYQGILSQVDAQTGVEDKGPFRLVGIRDIYASPVAADDRIYIPDRNGMTLVISHSDLPRLISANRLDDGFNASPVAVGKELFLRGERFLYCIAKTESSSAAQEK